MLLVMSGCTRMCGVSHRDMSPEQVVEAYLNIAFNMTSPVEKENLMRYTTGNLKAAIAGADEETVRKAYIERRYKVLKYAVVERRDRTPKETQITFQLTYNDMGDDKNIAADAAPKVTTENSLLMVREDARWLIKDIIGAKTSIDFPVSAESKIEAKAAP